MKGSEVTIVAPRIRGGHKRETIDGVAIRRVPYSRAGQERLAEDAILPALRANPWLIRQVPPLLVGLLGAVARETKQRRPEVLHAHWVVPSGVIAALVGRAFDIPYIVTAHGADAYALNGRIGRTLKKWVLGNALAVYPVSKEISQILGDLVPSDRLGPTLPMGVDGDRLRHDVGLRTPATGRVLFVGRLSDKKGVDVLLRAAEQTPAVTELRIVGDGPDRRELEALARELHIESRVEFLGHSSRPEVMAEYRSASVVAVPSITGAGGDRDGTPVVLMEAMALGIPVVGSAIGGMAEELIDGVNSLAVPPGEPAPLGAALNRLVSDPALADNLSRNAQFHAARFFEVERLASQLEADLSRRLAALDS